jgi:hypothetical protein
MGRLYTWRGTAASAFHGGGNKMGRENPAHQNLAIPISPV